MTTSFALFSHHTADKAFRKLEDELNRFPPYFAKHIPDAHTLTDAGLAEVMQGGVSTMTFAVIGLTGPAAELAPLVRILNAVRVPCAIVLCNEGWTALRRVGLTNRKNLQFAFILEPGAWDDGFDNVLTFFGPRGNYHRIPEPRLVPDMAEGMAPYLRQEALAAA